MHAIPGRQLCRPPPRLLKDAQSVTGEPTGESKCPKLSHSRQDKAGLLRPQQRCVTPAWSYESVAGRQPSKPASHPGPTPATSHAGAPICGLLRFQKHSCSAPKVPVRGDSMVCRGAEERVEDRIHSQRVVALPAHALVSHHSLDAQLQQQQQADGCCEVGQRMDPACVNPPHKCSEWGAIGGSHGRWLSACQGVGWERVRCLAQQLACADSSRVVAAILSLF